MKIDRTMFIALNRFAVIGMCPSANTTVASRMERPRRGGLARQAGVRPPADDRAGRNRCDRRLPPRGVPSGWGAERREKDGAGAGAVREPKGASSADAAPRAACDPRLAGAPERGRRGPRVRRGGHLLRARRHGWRPRRPCPHHATRGPRLRPIRSAPVHLARSGPPAPLWSSSPSLVHLRGWRRHLDASPADEPDPGRSARPGKVPLPGSSAAAAVSSSRGRPCHRDPSGSRRTRPASPPRRTGRSRPTTRPSAARATWRASTP